MKNYSKLTDKQLNNAYEGYLKQVEIHKDKITNPEKYIPEWNSFSSDRKVNTIRKWKQDRDRNSQLSNVVKGMLKERGL